jgi:D-alanyl-D-alanine carboxypeptidase
MRVRRSPTPRVVFASHSARGSRRSRAVAVAALVLLALALAGPVILSGARDGVGGAITRLAGRGPLADPGPQDGYVRVGGSLSPWSTAPAVARLTPPLRRAIRRAAVDARADGVALRVNSGWRSARYQEVLLRRAVRTYASEAEARRYVLPPGRSEHVAGKAVDVGPPAAAAWLALHGGALGLCRTYANEAWHFELAAAPGRPCPRPKASAGG